MNNLKKILQMIVDYYNEVGSGCMHNILLVFAQLLADVFIQFLWELKYTLFW